MNDERGENDLERQIDTLKARVKDLEEINQAHRQLNSELRKDIWHWKQIASDVESLKNLLQGHRKVIDDLSDKLRRKES